ncbi:MAG: BofC C-terminal domain-containing protein [Acutalibacteraceae bacterium]|nr:BofC C-terminal domain-containing protein [Acutalibacteraceae bacterium]
MSKRFNWFIWLAFLFFIMAAIITTLFSCDNDDNISNITPTEIQQATDYQTYIVREYDGMVAVFYNGQDKPVKVTDRYISALPQQDINELKRGIQVDNEENLRKLLEDLCS